MLPIKDASDLYQVERRACYTERPDFRITELQISPTQTVPWHYHSNVQDTFYVLVGQVRLFLREPKAEVLLGPGDTYSVSPKRPHLVTNAHNCSTTFLVLQGIGEILLGFNAELTADTEMLEAVCNENEQDLKHFVVTEADRKRHETVAKLAPEILAKYAGTYEPELAGPGASRRPFEITVEGDQVFLQLVNGASKFRWKPSPKPRSPRWAAQLFSSQMTGEPSPTLLYRS